ncbi:hypothetical protein Tco_0621223, partial [Tanacetum coccineum]
DDEQLIIHHVTEVVAAALVQHEVNKANIVGAGAGNAGGGNARGVRGNAGGAGENAGGPGGNARGNVALKLVG